MSGRLKSCLPILLAVLEKDVACLFLSPLKLYNKIVPPFEVIRFRVALILLLVVREIQLYVVFIRHDISNFLTY